MHGNLIVTWFNDTVTHDIYARITGSNPNAPTTVSASEATALHDALPISNATLGDPSASGTLTVHDVDSGENHFQTPASLAGTYGSYTFNPTTGGWGYTLSQSLADPLTAGQVVHDHLIVTSFDGTATHDIDVTITGSNDAPVITSVAQAGAVTELAGISGSATADTAAGAVTFTDLDLIDSHTTSFAVQAAGYLGAFSLDALAPDSTGGVTGSVG